MKEKFRRRSKKNICPSCNTAKSISFLLAFKSTKVHDTLVTEGKKSSFLGSSIIIRKIFVSTTLEKYLWLQTKNLLAMLGKDQVSWSFDNLIICIRISNSGKCIDIARRNWRRSRSRYCGSSRWSWFFSLLWNMFELNRTSFLFNRQAFVWSLIFHTLYSKVFEIVPHPKIRFIDQNIFISVRKEVGPICLFVNDEI